MSRHGYRGDGAFGQFCVVLPEQDAVVAITGGTEAMQAVLDHLWVHLLPGFNTGTLDDGAQPALEAAAPQPRTTRLCDAAQFAILAGLV